MEHTAAADMRGIYEIVMLVGFSLVYYVSHAVSELVARLAGRKLISHRAFGCIGVVFATAIMSCLSLKYIFDPRIYASMSAYDQGFYRGYIIGIPFAPALAVLIFVGARAWVSRRHEDKIRRIDLAHKKQMRVEPTFGSDS